MTVNIIDGFKPVHINNNGCNSGLLFFFFLIKGFVHTFFKASSVIHTCQLIMGACYFQILHQLPDTVFVKKSFKGNSNIRYPDIIKLAEGFVIFH